MKPFNFNLATLSPEADGQRLKKPPQTNSNQQQKILLASGILGLLALLALLLWPDLLGNLLAQDGFIPHGHCYLWKPSLVWLHVTSDTLIGIAYVAISTSLAYFVYKARKNIPFDWMFLAFGAFIIACGMTHFLAVWTLWNPTYWLSGDVKLITAIASVTTAISLPPLIPRALRLLDSAQVSEERRLNLERANLELQALYGQLKQLDELKSQFFANVSHELRTPLALILGPTQKLLADRQLLEEQHRDLLVIERNSRMLLKQVNDLLDISKLEAGKMELEAVPLNLASLIRQVAANFDALALEREINLTVQTPESLGTQLDRQKIERVVLNLLSNAFKFTPPGGQIDCSLSLEEGEGEKNPVTIAIQDSGPGVPLERRETIFERFSQIEGGSTRRFGGTGLGLAIVKEFVELHQGSITVSDASLGGAMFTVQLPIEVSPDLPQTDSESSIWEDLAESAIAELKPEADTTPRVLLPNDPRPLVLVVEDNPEMNRFVCDILGRDYQIATAFNGEQGLEQALTLHPDLILSDVMMPEIGGDRLVSLLRSNPDFADVSIIMLTAKDDDDLRVQLLREGVQDYLMKPFSVEELRARVGNAVAIKRVRDLLQQELASQSSDVEVLASELAFHKRELEVALILQQKQSEELIKANQIKDEFLSIVSHELRTPLNSILGWTQLLRTRKLNETMQNKALETIERNAKQQVNLIDDILDVSRIIRGKIRLKLRPVNLIPIVEAALDTMLPTAESKGIEIDFNFDPAVALVSGDSDRLQQVAWNLFSNAVKFTPNGGSISVAIAQTDSYITLKVQDTGIGINPDFLPHIFEGFRQADSSTTRAYGGLGLGLTIVRHLVELHGGKVQALSEGEGQGATLMVQLPILPKPPQEQAVQTSYSREEGLSSQLWALDGLQVLVVDDDPDTGDLMEAMLTDYGVRVQVVTSVSEAIALMDQCKFDVLVSDIGMPGEDGYHLIHQIRQHEADSNNHIPAIALTAFSSEEDRAQSLLAGFQKHLSKPVEPAQLARVLAQLASNL
ncbi:ATP-binding protein [Oscillatoria acuminata]|uniref:Circadian input-output histidine kinase CikA n=1 Tax=Oscillatoria acuminata PCC 6304 TaxID=56110 RepID=K9TLA8_9CYAN|nr:ATP-binding protein [Oscillatoria acuminata]AFY82784.1 histidine kinase,Response regulator receiver domain protein,histidine kinase [Oscillatoria acuminata PCC 6304]